MYALDKNCAKRNQSNSNSAKLAQAEVIVLMHCFPPHRMEDAYKVFSLSNNSCKSYAPEMELLSPFRPPWVFILFAPS